MWTTLLFTICWSEQTSPINPHACHPCITHAGEHPGDDTVQYNWTTGGTFCAIERARVAPTARDIPAQPKVDEESEIGDSYVIHTHCDLWCAVASQANVYDPVLPAVDCNGKHKIR